MPLDPGSRYNANCFAIAPNRDSIILRQESGAIASPQQNFKVYNIGRTKVYVELLYGTQIGWKGHVDLQFPVEPGETKIFYNKGRNYHTTGLKVYNQTDIRAVVHASNADGNYPMICLKEPGLYNYEYYKKLKDLFSVGVKYIPYLSTKFRGFFDAYWPSNKPNIWEQIEDKLEPLLEDHILHQVRGFLNSYIKSVGDRLKIITVEFENGRQAATYYMNIANDLNEFEEKLTYTGNYHYHKAINKFLLPLYSNFILMKITFYTLGIICSETLGLSEVQIDYIKNQINSTIKGDTGATTHITDMYKDWVEIVYDTCHPEDIYNTMMNTRSLIGLHGIEYSRIWDNMMRNPFTTGDKIYNDVISYSTFFGRPTPNLNKEAIAKLMAPPLTPCFVGFKRNYIRSVEVFLWRKSPSSSPKIGGARIVFENDNVHVLGTATEEVEKINFNSERIVKLIVTGDGTIDSCMFCMSDKRKLSFGTRESGTLEETFELKDHHIVSFFLSSDNVVLGGQAANIAVAYRLNDDYT